jgi:ZIP family zinc transporter
MLERLFVEIVGDSPVMQALVGGIVIAVFNTLGALVVLVWPNPSDQALDTALGFAAGVMLSASFTSLFLPGIDFASAPTYDAVSVAGFELVGIVPVIIGFALGVVLLDRADQWVPHVHVVITGKTRVEEDTPADASESPSKTPESRPYCCSSSPSRFTTCRRDSRSASASVRATSATRWR